MSIWIQCLECGAQFHDGVAYCPQCGEVFNLEPMMEEPSDLPEQQGPDQPVL